MRQGSGSIGGATLRMTPGDGVGAWQVTVDIDAGDEFANDLRGRIELVDPASQAALPVIRDLQLVAPGRYAVEFADVAAGQRLVRAQLLDPEAPSSAPPITDAGGQPIPGRLAAEASANLSIPWPTELAPDFVDRAPTERVEADDGPLLSIALDGLFDEARRSGPLADSVLRPAEPLGRQRTYPLWPWVLACLVLPLLIVDLLVRRTVEVPR